MCDDSIETLLLRHYGHTASTPPLLEQRLITSVRQEGVLRQQQEYTAARIRAYRMSRRRVINLVAIGSAGLGILLLQYPQSGSIVKESRP